jgi:DNA-binding response OmpR family regulator
MTSVVVIDDSPVVLRTLGLVLERSGFDVATATDGEAGLAEVERLAPPLVFVDVMMPGLDGYEVCRRIRASDVAGGRRTHLVMLTGSADEADRVRAEEVGVDEFMTKPFSPTGVIERVRSLLDGTS